MSQTFEVGQRVQYQAGGNWKPFGVVIDIQGGISLNDAALVSPMYKVRWDDGDESGWLSAHNLTSA